MEHAHATTKASRSRCMDLIHIWNLLCSLKLKKSLHGFNSYINLLMLQLKHQSRCMDVIHIWNLLMLLLRHQEVVAWM